MVPNKLHVQTFCLGDWQTNCYVVSFDAGKGSKPCWIIDAGFAPQPMIQHIRSHDLTPTHVILTHGHLDHIAGLHSIRAAWPGIPILIHREEELFLTEPELNLSALIDEPVSAPPATALLDDGQKLTLGDAQFTVLHTPGHSPGGITLYHAPSSLALVGDTLFAGSVGRTDFPTSDPESLVKSIREKLYTLPPATRVLPGHGPATTIAQERAANPYVRP